MTSIPARAVPDRHIAIEPPVLYVGTPVALITTLNPDGSANISPMSSIWMLGRRAILGLSAGGQAIVNLQREGELAINFPTAEMWRQVEAIARTTGRRSVPQHKAAIGYVFDGDKFATGGFTRQPSDIISTPRIAECPIQFEAQLVAAHATTRDDAGLPPDFHIVEAEVVRFHAREDHVIAGTQYVDTNRWAPLFYVFRHYFGRGADLGRTFKADH